MDSTVIEVRTGDAETVVDLTGEVERFLRSVGAGDGLLNIWVPHATAGLAVIETGAGTEAASAPTAILVRPDRDGEEPV